MELSIVIPAYNKERYVRRDARRQEETLIVNVGADNVLPSGRIRQAVKEFSRNTGLVVLSGPVVLSIILY